MLAKGLEVTGILISFVGLVGDDVLARWEDRIRAAIARATRLNWARRLLLLARRWFCAARNTLLFNEELHRKFLMAVFIIAATAAGLFGMYVRGSQELMLYEAQKEDPAGYQNSQFIVLGIAIALGAVVLLAGVISGFLAETAPFVLRILQALWSALRWLGKAYVVLTFGLLLCAVAIALLLPLAALLLGGLTLMLAASIFLAVGFLLVRVALLPYQLLDRFTVRRKLKSTILLIGMICTLVGALLR